MVKKTAEKVDSIDLNSVLSGADVSGTKKSKSDIALYPEKLEMVDKLIETNRKLEEYETSSKMLKDELKKGVYSFYREYLKDHRYTTSVRVMGTKNDNKVLISWQNKYNKIGLDFLNPIKEIVKEMFDNLFRTRIVITVKTVGDKERDETLLRELIEKVGKDSFAKYFEVKRDIVPTEEYTEKRFTVLPKSSQERLEEFVQQVSSVKVE